MNIFWTAFLYIPYPDASIKRLRETLECAKIALSNTERNALPQWKGNAQCEICTFRQASFPMDILNETGIIHASRTTERVSLASFCRQTLPAANFCLLGEHATLKMADTTWKR